MRWMVVALCVMQVFAGRAAAQSTPVVRVIGSHVVVAHDAQEDFVIRCPAGYIPTSYSFQDQFPADLNQELKRDLVDRNNAALDRNALSGVAQLDGAGYAVSLLNSYHVQHDVEAVLTCLAAGGATTDNALTLVAERATAAPQATVAVTSFCSADFPVALGGFSNADAVNLQESASAPVWGTKESPVALGDVPDGTMGPPAGWRVSVLNNRSGNAAIVSYSLCGKAPSLRTYVTSVPTVRGAFSEPGPFSMFSPVPDGWSAVGTGFDGGPYGALSAMDAWMQDGTVVAMQPWFESSGRYDSGAAEVRAFLARGLDTRRGPGSSAPGRAVLALLAMPHGPAPAPTGTAVVEFYNATLDHYFVTAFADEIAKLDNHTFAGWARTGQSFNAYGIGSAGRTGRRPVCRLYGRPDIGIDSHFYSASPDECRATLINTGGAWVLEASEVFEMDLPDPATGACPQGDVPVYRVWNKRRDSNHRYTTSAATRDQMVAKGAVAEGYGPDAVALCALP